MGWIMRSRRALFLCATVVLSSAVVSGCGDSHGGRKEVIGSVTLQEQPLKEGSILFEPLDGRGFPLGLTTPLAQ